MKLSRAFERVQRTTTLDVSDVLSITATVCFVQQKDKFSRIIAGQNLEKQKRRLMQKLLTGEIRVKLNDKTVQAKNDS